MNDPVAVVRPTREEWDQFTAGELADLGLTYADLAEQARTGQYQSTSARHLWILIGGKDERQ